MPRIRTTCRFELCNTQPTYGIAGQSATHCSKHKTDDMVDIHHPKCQHSDCKIRASFGLPDTKQVSHCVNHKTGEMVDLVHPRCQHTDCKHRPSFGLPGTKKPTHCAAHAEPSMVDVVHDRCQHPGCDTQPNYGFPTTKRPTHCVLHAAPNMVDVKNARCQHPHCSKLSSYGQPGCKRATHCAGHAEPNMINIVTPRCLTPLCGIFVTTKKYKGYCLRCFSYLFPDEPISRNHKVKEARVFDFLRSIFDHGDTSLVLNKRVTGGCSGRIPDVLIRCPSHVIVIEVDENQHVSYSCSCENKRLVQIWQDVNAGIPEGEYLPIVFIRFNPDGYTADGIKVPSCFGTHARLGTCVVRKKHEAAWQQRLETLRQTIKRHIDNVPCQNITEEHLYYDGFV